MYESSSLSICPKSYDIGKRDIANLEYQIREVLGFSQTGLQTINQIDVIEKSACNLRTIRMEIMLTMDTMDSFVP